MQARHSEFEARRIGVAPASTWPEPLLDSTRMKSKILTRTDRVQRSDGRCIR
jgi:hypothetical protein